MRTLEGSLAVLILMAPLGARAQDAATADQFVRHLYAGYHGKGPDYLGRQAPGVFAPPLLRLIRRDAAQTPSGDVGVLDGDPICDCQDFDGLHNLKVTVSGGVAGHAQAIARFQFFAEWRTVKLDLVAVQGHWRVSDVHTSSTPSLVALLNQSRPRK